MYHPLTVVEIATDNIDAWTQAAGDTLAAVLAPLANALVGIAAGALVLAAVWAAQRLRGLVARPA